MVNTGFSRATQGTIDDRSGCLCEVCGSGRASERHHRRPRAMGGSRRDTTNTAANGLHLCLRCHRLIEANRALALLMGWLLPQSAEPGMSRVMYRGDWALLHDDGSAAAIAA